MIADSVGPSFHDSSMSSERFLLPAFGERGLEFGHGLVDGEAGRLLTRRELFEALKELGDKRRGRKHENAAVNQPVPVGIRGDVGALEGVSPKVEQLGSRSATNGSAQSCIVPCKRCSMNTTFQLSMRTPRTSPSSEK